MADRFWSASVGNEKTQVAETAATTAGAHVEVRITYDNTNLVNNKQAALRLLELIEARIVEDTWPPV